MIKRCLHWMTGLLAAVGLTACDYFAVKELRPGVSTGFEVRERMGAPTMEWRNVDGTLTWEFSRQPEGAVNYMVVVGPDNLLREIRQVLTDENFARVERGMSEDNIRRLLGRPATRTPLALKKEVVWDWRYDAGPGRRMRFNVHFGADGRVLGTSRSEEHAPT